MGTVETLLSPRYIVERAGWLLASLSPANISKGKRLIAALSDNDRGAAERHARKLVSVYTTCGCAEAYQDHAYVPGTEG